MAHDVFVSYSSKDKAVADTIVAELEQKNIRCWYAPRDIKPGADWGDAIAGAISRSKVFIIVFSSNSNRSQHVLDELNMAITLESKILPFRIEKLDPSGAMFLHLASRHWLEAYTPSWKEHIDELVLSVQNIIGMPVTDSESQKHTPVARKRKPRRTATWIIGVFVLLVLTVLTFILGFPKLFAQKQVNTQAPIADAPTTTPMTEESVVSPTLTPHPAGPVLGSEENPLIFMYVPSEFIEFNEISLAVDEFAADFAAKNSGLFMNIVPAPDMKTVVDALCSNEAHVAALPSISYMVASEKRCAEAKLLWSAHEDIKYGGMVFTRTSEGYSDITQLRDKVLCIPSKNSMSGWILPSLEIMVQIGDPESFFGEVRDMGSHPNVLIGVYNGECEVGTSYFDVREASDLPGVMENISVLLTTVSTPNTNVSFSTGIPPELSTRLVDYFITASKESDALIKICNVTTTDEFVTRLIEILDSYYNQFRDLFERAGKNPADYQYTGL